MKLQKILVLMILMSAFSGRAWGVDVAAIKCQEKESCSGKAFGYFKNKCNDSYTYCEAQRSTDQNGKNIGTEAGNLTFKQAKSLLQHKHIEPLIAKVQKANIEGLEYNGYVDDIQYLESVNVQYKLPVITQIITDRNCALDPIKFNCLKNEAVATKEVLPTPSLESATKGAVDANNELQTALQSATKTREEFNFAEKQINSENKAIDSEQRNLAQMLNSCKKESEPCWAPLQARKRELEQRTSDNERRRVNLVIQKDQVSGQISDATQKAEQQKQVAIKAREKVIENAKKLEQEACTKNSQSLECKEASARYQDTLKPSLSDDEARLAENKRARPKFMMGAGAVQAADAMTKAQEDFNHNLSMSACGNDKGKIGVNGAIESCDGKPVAEYQQKQQQELAKKIRQECYGEKSNALSQAACEKKLLPEQVALSNRRSLLQNNEVTNANAIVGQIKDKNPQNPGESDKDYADRLQKADPRFSAAQAVIQKTVIPTGPIHTNAIADDGTNKSSGRVNLEDQQLQIRENLLNSRTSLASAQTALEKEKKKLFKDPKEIARLELAVKTAQDNVATNEKENSNTQVALNQRVTTERLVDNRREEVVATQIKLDSAQSALNECNDKKKKNKKINCESQSLEVTSAINNRDIADRQLALLGKSLKGDADRSGALTASTNRVITTDVTVGLNEATKSLEVAQQEFDKCLKLGKKCKQDLNKLDQDRLARQNELDGVRASSHSLDSEIASNVAKKEFETSAANFATAEKKYNACVKASGEKKCGTLKNTLDAATTDRNERAKTWGEVSTKSDKDKSPEELAADAKSQAEGLVWRSGDCRKNYKTEKEKNDHCGTPATATEITAAKDKAESLGAKVELKKLTADQEAANNKLAGERDGTQAQINVNEKAINNELGMSLAEFNKKTPAEQAALTKKHPSIAPLVKTRNELTTTLESQNKLLFNQIQVQEVAPAPANAAITASAKGIVGAQANLISAQNAVATCELRHTCASDKQAQQKAQEALTAAKKDVPPEHFLEVNANASVETLGVARIDNIKASADKKKLEEEQAAIENKLKDKNLKPGERKTLADKLASKTKEVEAQKKVVELTQKGVDEAESANNTAQQRLANSKTPAPEVDASKPFTIEATNCSEGESQTACNERKNNESQAQLANAEKAWQAKNCDNAEAGNTECANLSNAINKFNNDKAAANEQKQQVLTNATKERDNACKTDQSVEANKKACGDANKKVAELGGSAPVAVSALAGAVKGAQKTNPEAPEMVCSASEEDGALDFIGKKYPKLSGGETFDECIALSQGAFLSPKFNTLALWKSAICTGTLAPKFQKMKMTVFKKQYIPKIQDCIMAAHIITEAKRSPEKTEDFTKDPGAAKGGDAYNCTSRGLETLDYDACIAFRDHASGAEIAQNVAVQLQGMNFQMDMQDASLAASKNPDQAVAGLNTQKTAAEKQQDVANQQAAMELAKAAYLGSDMNSMPEVGDIEKFCDTLHKGDDPDIKLDPIDCKNLVPDATKFSFLINQKSRGPMKALLAKIAAAGALDLVKANMLGKQAEQIGSLIATIKGITPIAPTGPTMADLQAQYCSLAPTAPQCITGGGLVRTVAPDTGNNVIGFGGAGMGSVYTPGQQLNNNGTGGGGGATPAATLKTGSMGTTATSLNQRGGLMGSSSAAGIDPKANANAGGGGGGGGSAGGGGGGGGGAPAVSGAGGVQSAIAGKSLSYGGGGGTLSMMGGFGINKSGSKTADSGNPFGKMFDKGPKADMNFRTPASVGAKNDNLFEMISKRYNNVSTDKRLMEYEQAPVATPAVP